MGSPPEQPDRASAHAVDRTGSRRAFLARVTAVAVAPIALNACGKRPGGETTKRTGDDVGAPAAGDTSVAAEPAKSTTPAKAAGPTVPRSEPEVRVRVLSVRDRSQRLQVGAKGTWIEMRSLDAERATTEDNAGDDRGKDGDESAAASAFSLYHAPVTVALGSAGWSVVDARGFRPRVYGMSTLELRAVEVNDGAPAASTIAVDGRRYPGSVRFVSAGSSSSRGYDVINHVGLETYLPGVLEKELYSHWQPHTFAAQAVAARSYACSERFHFRRRTFDLTNTASSQMYIGSAAHERAIEAVRETRGMVLAHDGDLVPGYYSSCCGGIAATALDAISTNPLHDTPPLRGHSGRDVCTNADLFSWTIERSRRDVTRRLAAWGRKNGEESLASLGRLRAITTDAANAHGRPTAFAITGDAGTVALIGAERLRRAVDYSGAGLGRPAKRLWSSNVRITVSDDKVRFDGAGHGHGVGMCQHGAETLARDGYAFGAILEWYYPDARIVRGYV